MNLIYWTLEWIIRVWLVIATMDIKMLVWELGDNDRVEEESHSPRRGPDGVVTANVSR